ncbi:hypothetical protein ACNTMW_23615 [Planosporangium sp. 12N6]|uniref:hypothetical protein n=1 Tax=Planosporangium spinosum TaxID=3402278 RepID=UPI003CF29E2D
MNAMIPHLRTALVDLAEESPAIDLYEPVIRASRRRRRRRLVLTSVATAAIVGVTAAAAPALIPGPDGARRATSVGGGGQSRAPHTVTIDAGRVRAVDSPGGRRDDVDFHDAARTVDGDPATVWRTDNYYTADFGQLKDGMGVLLDLGSPQRVDSVEVRFDHAGATAELRAGEADPGDSAAGDAQVLQSYRRIGAPQVDAPSTTTFPGSTEPVRYLLVWITRLPRLPEKGTFQIGISEITVRTR